MTEELAQPALLQAWIGRSEAAVDRIHPAPGRALAALLDSAAQALVEGDPLPPLAHWLHFQQPVPQAQLGVDGHPHRGGFLPPVSLPRRMWAGGRLKFGRALSIGEVATRRSEIIGVKVKQGTSGMLVFVKVAHRIEGEDGQIAINEEQDIVYREPPRPGVDVAVPVPAPAGATWHRTIQPDPVLLFRYSALTFNGHRIHYDRPYACDVEGYSGLVVHGPLLATLLVDLVARNAPAARIAGFEFRAVRPCFDGDPLHLCGRPSGDGGVALWVADAAGNLCMEARTSLG